MIIWPLILLAQKTVMNSLKLNWTTYFMDSPANLLRCSLGALLQSARWIKMNHCFTILKDSLKRSVNLNCSIRSKVSKGKEKPPCTLPTTCKLLRHHHLARPMFRFWILVGILNYSILSKKRKLVTCRLPNSRTQSV